ncbi:MAG: DUF1513 domain-containing protein [Bacteriovoracaceae bacterium]
MERRDFLKVIASLGPLSLVSCDQLNKKLFQLFEGQQFMLSGSSLNSSYKSNENYLSIFNFKSGLASRFDINLTPHSFIKNPTETFEYFTFPKEQSGAARLKFKLNDLGKPILKKMQRFPPSRSDRYFYGHGCINLEKNELLCTESSKNLGQEGFIVIRDLKTLEVKREFPSFGSDPHDIKISNDKKSLIVANGGGKIKSNLCIIDLATEKLIEKYEWSDPQISFAHFEEIPDLNKICIAPRIWNGPIEAALDCFIINRNKKSIYPIISQYKTKPRFQFLSLCLNPKKREIAVTCPESKTAYLFDYEKECLIKELTLNDNPSGIIMDAEKKYYLINLAFSGNVSFVDPNSFQIAFECNSGIVKNSHTTLFS